MRKRIKRALAGFLKQELMEFMQPVIVTKQVPIKNHNTRIVKLSERVDIKELNLPLGADDNSRQRALDELIHRTKSRLCLDLHQFIEVKVTGPDYFNPDPDKQIAQVFTQVEIIVKD